MNRWLNGRMVFHRLASRLSFYIKYPRNFNNNHYFRKDLHIIGKPFLKRWFYVTPGVIGMSILKEEKKVDKFEVPNTSVSVFSFIESIQENQ